jgi:hypothetical protein
LANFFFFFFFSFFIFIFFLAKSVFERNKTDTRMTADNDTQEGDVISDDEFDSLLATIPLPGLPTPCDSSSGTQLKKRKTTTPTNTNEHIEQAAYEPIQFGEISKYMTNKRKKLKLQESALRDTEPENSIRPQIFSGLVIHVRKYLEQLSTHFMIHLT